MYDWVLKSDAYVIYDLFMCKVQGDTYRRTILMLLSSPVMLQEVALFYPKAETEDHSWSVPLANMHAKPPQTTH